ncbi:MAG: MFS transporter [Alphaproteobacteria bacterium]|nr:MFS transporter [Alphaproteobacteria bacterium]
MPFVALVDIQTEFGTDHATAMAMAFTVPGVLATLVEPPLVLLADRWPTYRRAFVVSGLLGMGIALGLGAMASGPVWLALALCMMFVGNGVGVNLAQATLMDADPERREHWMARWVLMGTLGDIAGPLLLGVLAWWGFGWRVAMGFLAAVVVAHAILLAFRPFPSPTDDDADDEEEVGWRTALAEAAQNRTLLAWLGGVALCGLLDEVFVALGAAWLEERFGATAAERGFALSLGTVGGVAGLAVLERGLSRGGDPMRWLRGASGGSIVALVAWLAAPDLVSSTVALVVLEALVVMLYPLAQARAYRALPGRSALVAALGGLLAPVDFVAPVLLGWIADRAGLLVALGLLGLQPFGLWLLARRGEVRSASHVDPGGP